LSGSGAWPVQILRAPDDAEPDDPPWPTRFRVSLKEALRALLGGLRGGEGESSLAYRFHLTMAVAIAQGAERLASEEGIRTVALGGGVFQNQLLLGMVVDRLEHRGLEPLLPRNVPANDGGISYGQLAAVSWELRAEG
jgi:hydrogenase maturation protein HypF